MKVKRFITKVMIVVTIATTIQVLLLLQPHPDPPRIQGGSYTIDGGIGSDGILSLLWRLSPVVSRRKGSFMAEMAF